MTKSPAIISAKSSSELTNAPILILNVDDEAGFLKITKQILEMSDAFQVDTALSVDEAMRKMKKKTYDAIVSDYQMRGKDGLQFLKQVRDSGNDIPFILFTGKGRESIAIQALNLGADLYFNKMGDPETVYGELVHGIRQAVERRRADEEVAKARDEYLSITNLTGDIIVNIDREGRWTFLNDVACMFWGKPRKELLGKKFREYLHPEDSENTAAAAIQETIETRQIVRGVINRQSTPKGWRMVEWNGAPLFDAAGDYIGYQATGRDVTERKRTEEVLRNREQEFRALVENAPDVISRFDKEFRHVYINPAVEQESGVPPEAFIGKTNRELGTPEALVAKWDETIRDVFETGQERTIDTEYKTPSEIKYYSNRLVPEFSEDGSVKTVLNISRNITERKKADEDIHKLTQFQQGIIDNADVWLNVLDDKGNVVIWNKAAEKISGYSKEEVIGHSKIWEWSYPEEKYRKEIFSKYTEIVTEGEVVEDFETQLRCKNGENKIISWTSRNLLDGKGNSVGSIALGRDITERKRAEEAIENLARFPSENPNPVLRITKDGVILYANESSRSFLAEWEREVGQSAPDYWSQKVSASFASDSSLRFEVEHLDRIFSFEISPVTDSGYVNVYGRDITERKKSEELLQRSEKWWVDSFNSLEDVMLIIDMDYTIENINDIGLKLFGKTRDEVIGKKCYQILHNLDASIERCPFKRTLKTGMTESIDLNDKTFDKYFNVNCSPIFNERDEIVRHVDLIRDITERKMREEEMKRGLMKFRLDDGNLYLVKESSPALSLEAFKDLLNVGYSGLVFSRTPEEEYKKNVDGTFEFRWLAERGGEKSLSPEFESIENSLEKLAKKSVILLDGLDYLVLKNGFMETLFFVQRLREFTYLTSNVFIFSIDPATLSAREVRLLEKEGREVESRVLVTLPEDLLELLRFIYEHNALGSKPNYTEVRQELRISKPTVGKRIKILVNTGYVTENLRGRSKVLELTHKGMRLFLK